MNKRQLIALTWDEAPEVAAKFVRGFPRLHKFVMTNRYGRPVTKLVISRGLAGFRKAYPGLPEFDCVLFLRSVNQQ